jgi:hypothetical protein
MYLLAIILHKGEHLEDVLSCLVELGIEEAVTLDSEPIKSILAYKVPIFAGLKFDLREKPFSKVIFALSENEDAGAQLVVLLKGVGVNIEEPGVARIFTLKLDSLFGEPESLGEI